MNKIKPFATEVKVVFFVDWRKTKNSIFFADVKNQEFMADTAGRQHYLRMVQQGSHSKKSIRPLGIEHKKAHPLSPFFKV
jgi:hypothetical protein